MSITPVNCTPIKPQVSFGNHDGLNIYAVTASDDNLEKFDRVYNSVKDIPDTKIKKPLVAAISVATAAFFTFISGKMIASKTADLAKTGVESLKNLIPALKGKNISLNLPELTNKAAKGISKGMKAVAENLKVSTPVTKGQKVKNAASKVVGFTEDKAKRLYKTVLYSNAETLAPEIANKKAFEKIGGIVALSTVFPSLIKRDENDNGVSDILEKGQNAYTGAKQKVGGVFEKVSKFAEVISSLT